MKEEFMGRCPTQAIAGSEMDVANEVSNITYHFRKKVRYSLYFFFVFSFASTKRYGVCSAKGVYTSRICG